jgi:hypothetical protein
MVVGAHGASQPSIIRFSRMRGPVRSWAVRPRSRRRAASTEPGPVSSPPTTMETGQTPPSALCSLRNDLDAMEGGGVRCDADGRSAAKEIGFNCVRSAMRIKSYPKV